MSRLTCADAAACQEIAAAQQEFLATVVNVTILLCILVVVALRVYIIYKSPDGAYA